MTVSNELTVHEANVAKKVFVSSLANTREICGPHAAGVPTWKALLGNRPFRLLLIGNGISSVGDQFFAVALPWLVLTLTGSSIALGTISMVAAIPSAVFMLVGGAVTDRLSPRRILIVTAVARSQLVVAVAALLFLNSLHLWALYVIALGFGVAKAFSYPAASTYVPSIVAPEQLSAANSVSQSMLQGTTLCAPAPAGLFIQAFGTAWAFVVDAVSFLAIIAALFRLPDPPEHRTQRPQCGTLRSITEGLRYVYGNPALRSLMLVAATMNFALEGPMGVGIAVIAKQQFGTPDALGLLISTFAAGSLVGMLCAGIVPQRRRGIRLLVATIIVGLCVAPIGVLGRLSVLVPDLFILSGTIAFVNIQFTAWFQQSVDRAVLGRVISVISFAAVGLTPLSLAIAGITLKTNYWATFLGAGCLVILATSVAASHRAVRAIE